MTNLCVPLREATAKAGCVKKTRPPPRHHLPKFLEQTTHTAMLAAFCVTLEYYVLVKVFAAAAGTADEDTAQHRQGATSEGTSESTRRVCNVAPQTEIPPLMHLALESGWPSHWVRTPTPPRTHV